MEPVFLHADQEPGPRGLGPHIFGVGGQHLLGEDKDTIMQNFLFNNGPMIELYDLPICLAIMQLREKYFDPAVQLQADLVRQAAPFVLLSANMINHSLYTQSLFRFGGLYGNVGLFPVLNEMTNTNEKVKSRSSRERLKMVKWLL